MHKSTGENRYTEMIAITAIVRKLSVGLINKERVIWHRHKENEITTGNSKASREICISPIAVPVENV